MGPHYSLTHKRVLLPIFGSKGGDTLDCGGEGVGNPLPTKGQALLLCILYEESVRARLKKLCMFSSQEYYSTEKQTGFMANIEFKNEREGSLAKKRYNFKALKR
jgi:hypothetical protein